MKPLPSSSRHATPTSPSAWLLREIVVVLAVKAIALTALWWAFFSSPERPQPVDAGHTVLDRQAASPVTHARSTE